MEADGADTNLDKDCLCPTLILHNIRQILHNCHTNTKQKLPKYYEKLYKLNTKTLWRRTASAQD